MLRRNTYKWAFRCLNVADSYILWRGRWYKFWNNCCLAASWGESIMVCISVQSWGESITVCISVQSWVKRDQLDVTCFIISLLNAQHVSDVNTSILRSLRLMCWVISWVVLLWFDVCWCYVVVWLWWCGIRMQAEVVPQPAYGYHTTTT